MLLTVAWELSWYQFVVDLSDGREPVRVRGQGQELDELPREARQLERSQAAEDGAMSRRRDAAWRSRWKNLLSEVAVRVTRLLKGNPPSRANWRTAL